MIEKGCECLLSVFLEGLKEIHEKNASSLSRRRMEYVTVAQDRDRWQAHVNGAMNIRVSLSL